MLHFVVTCSDICCVFGLQHRSSCPVRRAQRVEAMVKVVFAMLFHFGMLAMFASAALPSLKDDTTCSVTEDLLLVGIGEQILVTTKCST